MVCIHVGLKVELQTFLKASTIGDLEKFPPSTFHCASVSIQWWCSVLILPDISKVYSDFSRHYQLSCMHSVKMFLCFSVSVDLVSTTCRTALFCNVNIFATRSNTTTRWTLSILVLWLFDVLMVVLSGSSLDGSHFDVADCSLSSLISGYKIECSSQVNMSQQKRNQKG